MPATANYFLNATEVADLREVMKVVEQNNPALFQSAGERSARDRNFIYPRNAKDLTKGYRATTPTEAFARRLLALIAVRQADLKKLREDDEFRDEVDRLIDCHQRLSDGEAQSGTPFDALPEKYRKAISDFYAAGTHDMESMFDGYKIVFRVAFEDSGRIAREVIRFSERNGRTVYSWWFQAAGSPGPENRRENEGVVLPLRTCYLLTGFHDSGRVGELRFRSAVIERKESQLEPTVGVEVGITTSTNAQGNYPAATKFLWVTTEGILDEKAFLDRTVGFFGTPGTEDGLASLRESFEGAQIDDAAIKLIWDYIDNKTEGTQLLSTPQGATWARQVSLLLRQNWKTIINTYSDASVDRSTTSEQGTRST
jgi:hypothetical protein